MERFQSGLGESGLYEYFQQISKIPLLTCEEEQALAHRVQEGDQEARNQLIQANLRLVVSIAKNYVGRGLSLSDLIAEGNLGLLKAAERYKPNQNSRFATYATWWIKQAIQKALVETAHPIRIPPYMQDLMFKYRQIDLKDREDLREVAQKLGISEKTLLTLLHSLRLVSKVHHVSDLATFHSEGEYLADKKAVQPEEEVAQIQQAEHIHKMLQELAERERKIIQMRFGLGPYSEMTLEEIGKRMGISRERVRQIEHTALQKLYASLQDILES